MRSIQDEGLWDEVIDDIEELEEAHAEMEKEL